MAQGDKYIGTMIGTMDGECESKSKYITVEVATSSAAVTASSEDKLDAVATDTTFPSSMTSTGAVPSAG